MADEMGTDVHAVAVIYDGAPVGTPGWWLDIRTPDGEMILGGGTLGDKAVVPGFAGDDPAIDGLIQRQGWARISTWEPAVDRGPDEYECRVTPLVASIPQTVAELVTVGGYTAENVATAIDSLLNAGLYCSVWTDSNGDPWLTQGEIDVLIEQLTI